MGMKALYTLSLISLLACSSGPSAEQLNCQAAIDKLLVSPSTANYSVLQEELVWISVAVDSQNGFGAMIRSYYKCIGPDNPDTMDLFEIDADGNVIRQL